MPRRKRSLKKPKRAVSSKFCPVPKNCIDKERFELINTWVAGIVKDGVYSEPEIESNDSDDDEEDFDIEALQKSLNTILKKYSADQIKRNVLFECEWKKCDFEVNNEEEYRNHIWTHMDEINKDDNSKEKCHWNLCKLISKDLNDFIRHLDYHIYHSILKNYGLSLKNLINIPKCLSNSKQRNDIPIITQDYICNWNDCCKTYNKFPEFINHLNYHLTLDYDTKKTLGSYVGKMENRKSISKTKVKCKWDDCNKEIVNIYELKRHMRLHTREKTIGCPVCGKLFTKMSFYIEHCIRQISSEREFQCSQCFKYFATEGMLKDHERSHLNKFKCNICGMSCPSRNVLATHIRYRHVATKPFSCDHPDCEYRATTKRDITMHKMSHTNEKMYKCEMFQCDFSAKTLMSLKRHDAREHLGTPLTYQCHICERNFTRGFALSKHLKKQHCFALAAGHTRFIYKVDEDGLYRLQTKRVECLAANQQEVNAVNKFVPEADASYSMATFTKGDEKHEGVSMKFEKIKNPAKKTAKKVVTDDGHKNINDFAIMKNYNFMRNNTRSTRKQISVEFQDLDEFGVTISKKMIKVPEITI